MSKKKILALPVVCFWSVVGICLLVIGLGSFCDLDIGIAMAHKTEIGKYFATFSPVLAYALLPAGGTCIFVAMAEPPAPPQTIMKPSRSSHVI